MTPDNQEFNPADKPFMMRFANSQESILSSIQCIDSQGQSIAGTKHGTGTKQSRKEPEMLIDESKESSLEHAECPILLINNISSDIQCKKQNDRYVIKRNNGGRLVVGVQEGNSSGANSPRLNR